MGQVCLVYRERGSRDIIHKTRHAGDLSEVCSGGAPKKFILESAVYTSNLANSFEYLHRGHAVATDYLCEAISLEGNI